MQPLGDRLLFSPEDQRVANLPSDVPFRQARRCLDMVDDEIANCAAELSRLADITVSEEVMRGALKVISGRHYHLHGLAEELRE